MKSEMRPVIGVGVVVFNDRGDVLLIRRGTPPRQGEWSIPGGKQEWGETVRDAARREVHEESGLEVEVLGLVDVVDLRHPAAEESQSADTLSYHYTLIDFAALAVGGEMQAGSDAAAVCWVAPEALAGYGLWDETVRVISAARRFLP